MAMFRLRIRFKLTTDCQKTTQWFRRRFVTLFYARYIDINYASREKQGGHAVVSVVLRREVTAVIQLADHGRFVPNRDAFLALDLSMSLRLGH